MDALDLAGHGAYTAVALGMFLLARRNHLGWLARVVGDTTWIVIGLMMGMTCIWTWGIYFAVNDVYGWRKWLRENHPSPSARDEGLALTPMHLSSLCKVPSCPECAKSEEWSWP